MPGDHLATTWSWPHSAPKDQRGPSTLTAFAARSVSLVNSEASNRWGAGNRASTDGLVAGRRRPLCRRRLHARPRNRDGRRAGRSGRVDASDPGDRCAELCGHHWIPRLRRRDRQLLLAEGTDTWTWDGARWAHRPDAAGPHVADPVSAYDPSTRQVVMVGGPVTASPVTVLPAGTETWTWNGNVWAQQHPATSPAMAPACAAFDDATGQLLMFGGLFPQSPATWRWTGSNWVRLSPAASPPNGQCSMAYDPGLNTMVLATVGATSEVPEARFNCGLGMARTGTSCHQQFCPVTRALRRSSMTPTRARWSCLSMPAASIRASTDAFGAVPRKRRGRGTEPRGRCFTRRRRRTESRSTW